MNSFRKALLVACISATWVGCDCSPVIDNDGGTGGGTATGGGTSTGGGTAAGGGTAVGGGTAAGGGSGGGSGGGAGGGSGGGAGGGSGGGGGGAAAEQFTQYVRDLIDNATNGTSAGRPASEWQALPDDAPVTFDSNFFDGGL